MAKKDQLRVAQVIHRKRVAYATIPDSISPEGRRLLESCVLVVDNLAYDLADAFAQDDLTFDRDRFLISAGVPR